MRRDLAQRTSPCGAIDLCSDSDDEAGNNPAVPGAVRQSNSVVDLCASSDNELEDKPTLQQTQQQEPQQNSRQIDAQAVLPLSRRQVVRQVVCSTAPCGVNAAPVLKQEQPALQLPLHPHVATESGATTSLAPDGATAGQEEGAGSEARTDALTTSCSALQAGEEPAQEGMPCQSPLLQQQQHQQQHQQQQHQQSVAADTEHGGQAPMDWEASPAAAADGAARTGSLSQPAAAQAAAAGGLDGHDGEDDVDRCGGSAACSLQLTEALDSLAATEAVDEDQADSEHSCGSPWQSPLAGSGRGGIQHNLYCPGQAAGEEKEADVPDRDEQPQQQEQQPNVAAPNSCTHSAAAAAAAAAADGGGQAGAGDATQVSAVAAQTQPAVMQNQPASNERLQPSLLHLAHGMQVTALSQQALPAAAATAAATTATVVAAATAAAAAAVTAAAAATVASNVVSAAAAAAAGGADLAAGPSTHAAAGSPSGAADEEDDMPDESDAGAMLQWLRSKIPAELLEQYNDPHEVSDEEFAVTLQRLQTYEEGIERVQKAGTKQCKFDLVAASELPRLHPEWGLWERAHGHTPGVRLGQQFKGRGWLQALGVHTQYYNGIMSKNGAPAYAICLSGGYEDDEDKGDWLSYTGEGGRIGSNCTQGADQQWTKGNAAIRANCEQRKPVRLVRGLRVEQEEYDPKTTRMKMVKRTQYTYDGLYYVVRAKRAVGKGGKALVCKFLMVGIPGHYKANKSVSFAELRGFRDRVRLAGGSDDEEEEEEEEEEVPVPARSKRQKTGAAGAAARAAPTAGSSLRRKKSLQSQHLHPALVPVTQGDAWLAEQQMRPGFLCADVSGGVEKFKVPAFNEVDAEPLPTGLTYIRTSTVGSAAAQNLLDEGLRVMPSTWCGLERGDSSGAYLRNGLMHFTRCEGQWECPPNCKRPKCRHNRFVSEHGLVLPLEVFRTASKGWGVRCTRDIPAGAFICSYEGCIISHDEAEERRGTDGDSYFFDLDHFVLMYEDPSVRGSKRMALPPLPFDVAPKPATNDTVETLVLDAATTGNLARFINHSCSPNLTIQPILRPGDSALRYLVGVFAEQDIPAGRELCYNYKYTVGSAPQKVITCHCGAKNCKGRLI
ncbi:hypothetical protein D9Q98_001999 [Chlorella vulgaris]|uniref:Uncharacterized protein n=1 Tax=Chlorella vulgaris TaxID=3077 RepID=A0A9D4TVF2_CHLVU|nr:hypothetical protein D9Q98_001999 [Chlorella vulgaris]